MFRLERLTAGGTDKLVCPWGLEGFGSSEATPANKFADADHSQVAFDRVFV
jgi:hypothetical protein